MYRQLWIVVMGLIWCGSITTEGENSAVSNASVVTMVTPDMHSEQPAQQTSPGAEMQQPPLAAPMTEEHAAALNAAVPTAAPESHGPHEQGSAHVPEKRRRT